MLSSGIDEAPGETVASGGRAPDSRVRLAPGQPFGPRYHIVRLVGTGGMGSVYEAFDNELSAPVAIKIMRPDMIEREGTAGSWERRFKRELVLARQVTHKNVVRIHDLGDVGGVKYLSMPLLRGESLSAVLRRSVRLPINRALTIARGIAAGLAAAHEEGVIHRDLKPANIFLEDGPPERAVILDFGIAQSPSSTELQSTSSGTISGTLDYMAPEQARGEPPDARGDVYSFGLILREMLVGRDHPSDAGSAFAALMRRSQEPPPPVRSIDPHIPEPLSRVVSRCVEPDPARRYASSAELLADLERLGPDGQPLPGTRAGARPKLALAAVAAALALAAGAYLLREPAGSPDVAATPDPISILIADFDNRSNDPVFEGSIEEALSIGIESAAFVSSFSRREARRLAGGGGPDEALGEEAARLVAIREGLDVVLTGAIEPAGAGYQISVRALETTTGRELANEFRTAASKERVLDTVGRLAAALRLALGDSPPDSAALAAETFTAASLDAVHAYTQAQDLARSFHDEEAVELYRQAVVEDPEFGRAHAGLAVSLFKLGRALEAQDAWNRALALMDRVTERERYRTLGGYYLQITNNYEQAVENYRTLVERYPADGAGWSNLAVAHFNLLEFDEAKTASRRAIDLEPSNILRRSNDALYAMYAGEFDAAREQAALVLERDPGTFKAHLALAVASFAAGDLAGTRDRYRDMAGTGPRGESLASMGSADLALYEGRPRDAEALLLAGIDADERDGNTAARAAKQVALAEAKLALDDRNGAAAAVEAALAGSRRDAVLIPAARLLMAAGREQEAERIAGELAAKLQPQARAYARILDAELALRAGRVAEAADALRESRRLADVWLGRYLLGIVFVEAGDHAAALAELDACVRRRGEATAIFLDDVPTLRYAAPLTYWMGRAQEGLGQREAAAQSYRRFLELRLDSTDPLAADARRRLDAS